MPTVTFHGQAFELAEGESVLNGMERQGVMMESGCRSGVCHTCMMVAVSGDVPELSQTGLTADDKADGAFLPCICIPDSDLEIARHGEAGSGEPATVTALEKLSDTVIKLRVRPDTPVAFKAGQFFNVIRDDGLTRSYSAANLPADGDVEFHVRRIDGGAMSPWVHDQLAVGDSLKIQGPHGQCVYGPDSLDEPLLLAGTGTGLAPLQGILLDAIDHGHTGPIHLYHGALTPAGLYGQDTMKALADSHDNVTYTPCVLEGGGDGVAEGDLGDLIDAEYKDLAQARIYLCGDGGYIKALQRKLFLCGARMNAILADAFSD